MAWSARNKDPIIMLEEFFFPTIVLVLSTQRVTQFSHGMPYLSNFSSIEDKIHAAVAQPSANIKQMSKKWQVAVLERLISKILTQTGFIFSMSVSFDQSVPTEKG